MSRLVREGWVSPGGNGPNRRNLLSVVLITVLAVGGVLGLLRWHGGADGAVDARRTVTISVDRSGAATARGKGVRIEGSSRRGNDAIEWQVVRARFDPRVADARSTTVRVELPSGVDATVASLRVVAPGDAVQLRRDGSDAPSAVITHRGADAPIRLLVLVPAQELEDAPSRGPLSDVTDPFDDARLVALGDADRLDRLRALRLPGIVASVMVVLLLLWLWRRAARGFFSMRLPGGGTAITAEAPSSIGPIDAAVLVAGAGPLDVGTAFAGQVLDLVERRRLPMRRTLDPTHGSGALLGLGHVEEDAAVAEDPAIVVLRSIAIEEGLTAVVPDSADHRPTVPAPVRVGWAQHVYARDHFARVSESFDLRRLTPVAAAAVFAVVISIVVAVFAPTMGTRDTAWFVAGLLAGPASVLGAWWLDARHWRRVERSRRLERAQWLQWIRAVGTPEGPALNHRSIPVVVAAGQGQRVLPEAVRPEAVELGAVTRATVATLRAMVR